MVHFTFRQVLLLLLHLVLFLFSSLLLCASSDGHLVEGREVFGSGSDRRVLLEMEKDQVGILKKKNQTKLVKPNMPAKNQTKLTKTSLSSSKNQTKLKPENVSSAKGIVFKSELKKLNTSSQLKKKLNSTSKASNFTKNSSGSTKKSLDLIKLGSSKNKTMEPSSAKQTPISKLSDNESQKQKKTPKSISNQKGKKPISWLDQMDDDDDLISEFRDLPQRFHQTIQRDLESISMTSKKYLTKANKEMTRGFKPIVGNKYASTIASVVSFAFVLIPLLLVSLVVNRIKAYFSLQKVLIFIQVYLSIYFSILCITSLVTGLEPLKFFYATSQSTYICLMVLQTLGYVFYLLLLLMYLVLVFSTECGLSTRFLGLGQTFVGFAVGLHYYVAVFHRVVLHQPPKTNWKVHGVYATCFLVVCLFSRADRRKKEYVEEGGEEGKMN
ncbi:hypothetical protein K2173_005211 [Erythroxylum novogranatense]|uniref:Uncharacterized protein n=1 Tax=Erythroxylum novogranatense TaxID=1862640 RepID=A0AAV8TV21_9ROSI|nr:hypothetical protein K2173_005211 [Erythroxylum novogranatense]